MKVLVVVEDSDEMQMIVKLMLAKDARLDLAGSASTAAEAIAAVEDERPDLVIMDHFIDGDVMGLEAAPLINEVSPNTKVLLFSDYDLASEAAAEPAVDAFLPKRRLNALLPTVRELVGIQD